MGLKRIIPCIFLKDNKAVKWFDDNTIINDDVLSLVNLYNYQGADEILIYMKATTDEEKEEAFHFIKKIKKETRIPIAIGGNVDSLEDVKKILYTGASKVVIILENNDDEELIKASAKRFGKEKITVAITDFDVLFKHMHTINNNSKDLLVMHKLDVKSVMNVCTNKCVVFSTEDDKEKMFELLADENIRGITGPYFSNPDMDFFDFKEECKKRDIPVSTFESNIDFSDFKTNDQGLVPVIVQHYKTQEVLMLAYMNEDAFYQTIKTGKMTYFSRSRKSLWVKGETSGHTQYLKSLNLDCDNDTLLAKVDQIGAACHTGNPTCFFNPVTGSENEESNPLKVFMNLYDTITDRRENPKEGSYTNYLFEKGLDKILKKIGEEASEIIIAAKNPVPEEIKYEIADFLYHMTVLMVDKDISWNEIIEELNDR
ncbi:MAG: bifunctional phosphoribosyl-AMP cyclohydrolase/phosphoribosyl-ATP diphosphatase HisIE [Suipraeoptans sp.]